jgi:hypothetical protein
MADFLKQTGFAGEPDLLEGESRGGYLCRRQVMCRAGFHTCPIDIIAQTGETPISNPRMGILPFMIASDVGPSSVKLMPFKA